MMMQAMDLSDGVTTHREGAEVNGGIGGREPLNFLGNPWEAHPLWMEIVWMDRVNGVHSIQTR